MNDALDPILRLLGDLAAESRAEQRERLGAQAAFGMLTLDALEPGDLTEDDMRLLRLMAGALAVALATL